MASTTTTTTLTLLLTLFLLFSLSSATSTSTLLDAADILSAAGFESMALHLELASQTLQPPHSVTIFAPSDGAFEHRPHVPLSLLRFHLLPHSFSFHSLTSLPSGAAIPTLLPHHSLTVTTTTPHRLSLNNITINPTPLFHTPHLSIFTTHTFFNPTLHQTPPNPPTCPNKTLFSLQDASRALHARGFSLMASVLDVQFPAESSLRRELTLFAPPDEAIAKHVGNNFTEFPTMLHSHLVPCKIALRDLANLEDSTLIATYERGFAINVTKSATHVVLLNGVTVVFPEMYRGDSLVVHGVRHVLSGHMGKGHHHHHHHREENRGSGGSDRVYVAERDDGDEQEFSEFDERESEGNSPQHYHFSVFH